MITFRNGYIAKDIGGKWYWSDKPFKLDDKGTYQVAPCGRCIPLFEDIWQGLPQVCYANSQHKILKDGSLLPYRELKVDDIVEVYSYMRDRWFKMHYHSLSGSHVNVYSNGQSSKTSIGTYDLYSKWRIPNE